VDAHVSRAIFEEAILGELGRGRGATRILILSSNYHLLHHMDHIVIIEGGTIVGQGSFDDLSQKFPRYLNGQDGLRDTEDEASGGRDRSGSSIAGLPDDASGKAPPARTELIQKEDREVGSVSWGVYLLYFSGATSSAAGGALLGFGTLAIFLLSQGMRVAVDYWLAEWAKSVQNAQAHGLRAPYSHAFAVGIFWLLLIVTVVLTLGRSFLVLWTGISSCSAIHKRLLSGILRAPVNTYFDVTPTGRILNRFSKDLDHLDQPLPETLLQVSLLL
jgi:ATP-binding cassette, subfamily C (CFTR/MRP), member 1